MGRPAPEPVQDVKPAAEKPVAVAAAEKPERDEAKGSEAPYTITVSPPEPPKPITRPVDDKVAQAREKPTLLGWFVGQTMKATGGKANPAAVNALLKAKLGIE